MRITDPWQKKVSGIINIQGKEDNRYNQGGQKTTACLYWQGCFS